MKLPNSKFAQNNPLSIYLDVNSTWSRQQDMLEVLQSVVSRWTSSRELPHTNKRIPFKQEFHTAVMYNTLLQNTCMKGETYIVGKYTVT